MTAEQALRAFEDLADELAPRDVVRAPLFGKQALKHELKAFACLHLDALAFRLAS